MKKSHFKKIGSIGGKKSRRKLTPAQARAMVRAREKKRKRYAPIIEALDKMTIREREELFKRIK